MTVIVGVLCRDKDKTSVVIGADSSVTLAANSQVRTIEQASAKKITILHERVIVASSGPVGMGQRLRDVIDKYWAPAANRGKEPLDIARGFSKVAREDFVATQAPTGKFCALVAYPARDQAHLCEFEPDNLQPELKTHDLWFASIGSGQQIADPFLGMLRRVFWREQQPTHAEGLFAVTWTLQQAIDLNPGGIQGPLNVAELHLTQDGYHSHLLDEKQLGEHINSVQAAEAYLGKYKRILGGGGLGEPPQIPPGPKI